MRLATDSNALKVFCTTIGRQGAPGRTRTCNLRIRRPLLYPLSYEGRGAAQFPRPHQSIAPRPRPMQPRAIASSATAAAFSLRQQRKYTPMRRFELDRRVKPGTVIL